MEPFELINSSDRVLPESDYSTHIDVRLGDSLYSVRDRGREIVRVGADGAVVIASDATMDELREAIMVMAPMAAEMVRR